MPRFAPAASRRLMDGGTGDSSGVRPGRPRTLTPAGVFALLVALLSGLLVTFGPAAPAAAGEPEVIHGLVNEARAEHGLRPLTRNAGLDAVAASWAQQMANMNSLQHNPDVGSQIPGGWTRCGENIAQGYPTGAAMHQGWMDSPGHRENIMGDFTDIGIAFLEAGGTTWGVEVFAKYPGATAAPAPVPAPAPPAVQPAPELKPELRIREEQTAADAEAAEKAAAEKEAAEKAAKERAAAEKKAADKEAADEKAAEQAAREKAAAERSAAAAAKQRSAEKRAAIADTGSAPTATATPGQGADEAAAVPTSTSMTSAIDQAASPVVLVGMGLVLLTALVLLSPTLRRLVLPRRRRARHR